MSVLISGDALIERRAVIAGSHDLTSLRACLDDEISRVLAHPLYVPEAKALLSRWGGHCRDDGAELDFDPFTPHEQRCTRCGRIWATEQTHRWWVTWYQLWLAERVLLMALLVGEGGAASETSVAQALEMIVARYDTWPNADNVLGPSRPFFSTYLESVWVLQLAAATSVLEELGKMPSSLGADLRARLFRPSAAIIADFDEGRSNRQVWNAAALYALGRLLGDEAMAREAAHGPSGLVAALETNVLADGLWYEGENYHWFALRGLAWGAEMLRTAGTDLWQDAGVAGARLRAAFRAPILTVLPDFTFPARRDSKFGVSLRQRRMAEMWELALARGDVGTGGRGDGQAAGGGEFYASLLRHVYDEKHLEGSEDWKRITDVERSEPPTGVRRGRLGWKALVWALPELPPADPAAWQPGTSHLEATGLAIFRRDEGRSYVSLDYGESGGGHGHPDRLNLTVVTRDVPWLLDFGTGSYVSRSLAWYRASLAHNAPLLDGVSQLPTDGVCLAFDEQAPWGWICAALPEGRAYEHAAIQRTVVLTPTYILDIVQMRSESGERQLAVPWHGLGAVRADEHGLTFANGENVLRILLSARQPFSVAQQRGAGPPPAAPGESEVQLEYAVAIATGEELTLAACLAADNVVTELECVEEDFIVRLADGGMHMHRATDEGWEIELDHGDPVQLGGVRELPEDASTHRRTDAPSPAPSVPPLVLDREEQFRRAQEPWDGPENFSARAQLKADDDDLIVDVDVTAPQPHFRPDGAEDPEWDNENPDIHSDGVQVYLETAGFFGWLIVPVDVDTKRLRVSAVSGTDAEVEMVTAGAWKATPRGYTMRFTVTLPEPPQGDVGFDLYVNRARADRERRVGQLVWSGARGTRLYLAGDRALPGPLPRVRL